MKNIGQTVYNTTAEYGRVKAYTNAFIGSIFSLIFIIISVMLLLKKNKYSKTTSANILSAECKEKKSEESSLFDCDINLEYTIDDSKYTKNLNSYGNKYYSGESITIGYNPENINDIALDYNVNKIIGFTMLFISLFSFAMVWINVYVVKNSKIAASAQGVTDITQSLFRRKNNA